MSSIASGPAVLDAAHERFASAKPLAWASRQFAEQTALAALGLVELRELEAHSCHGSDDRFGSARHLGTAVELAADADREIVERAQHAALAALGAMPIAVAEALRRQFAFDTHVDLLDAADALLDAAVRAVRRRLDGRDVAAGLSHLRALPPLSMRDDASEFAEAMRTAVRDLAVQAGLSPSTFAIVDGGAIATRMWRRWFVIDAAAVYIVEGGSRCAAPQDAVWRFIHDAAHLAHAGDLLVNRCDSVVALTDAPYIGIAEGFALLAEAQALGLVEGGRPLALPVDRHLVEAELLLGLVERCVRFRAEVGGDYNRPALERLAARAGSPLDAVASTVFEWRGLAGMGSCYVLGLLAALKAREQGRLVGLLRFDEPPPPIADDDVDSFVTALDALA